MNVSTRRTAIGSLLAGAFALAGTRFTSAQYGGQQAGNGADIVATGDVHLGQSVSASQVVDGQGSVYGTGIQVVTNDGRIVATGDVWVNQEAAASHTITSRENGLCRPGTYWNDHKGTFYFCDTECQVLEIHCGHGCRRGKCR